MTYQDEFYDGNARRVIKTTSKLTGIRASRTGESTVKGSAAPRLPEMAQVTSLMDDAALRQYLSKATDRPQPLPARRPEAPPKSDLPPIMHRPRPIARRAREAELAAAAVRAPSIPAVAEPKVPSVPPVASEVPAIPMPSKSPSGLAGFAGRLMSRVTAFVDERFPSKGVKRYLEVHGSATQKEDRQIEKLLTKLVRSENKRGQNLALVIAEILGEQQRLLDEGRKRVMQRVEPKPIQQKSLPALPPGARLEEDRRRAEEVNGMPTAAQPGSTSRPVSARSNFGEIRRSGQPNRRASIATVSSLASDSSDATAWPPSAASSIRAASSASSVSSASLAEPEHYPRIAPPAGYRWDDMEGDFGQFHARAVRLQSPSPRLIDVRSPARADDPLRPGSTQPDPAKETRMRPPLQELYDHRPTPLGR